MTFDARHTLAELENDPEYEDVQVRCDVVWVNFIESGQRDRASKNKPHVVTLE